MRIRVIPFAVFTMLMLVPAVQAQDQPSPSSARITSYETIVSGLLEPDTLAVYRWNQFPDILIIHFENYLLQGLTLNRIATYLEKAGMRGKVVSWKKLRTYLKRNNYSMENLYSAHDYRTSDLALFFNVLSKAGEPLNEHEQSFLNLLADLGLINWNDDDSAWQATGNQAVLSFATRYLGEEQPSSNVMGKYHREFEAHSVYHEMRHGLYFTEPEYAQSCRDYWNNVLSYDDKRALRLALLANNYDSDDEELMINEWQAYLLTPPYAFIGVNALSTTLYDLASGRRIFRGWSQSDRRFLERYGMSLADDLDFWMADDLRKWHGERWDLPSIHTVISYKMKY